MFGSSKKPRASFNLALDIGNGSIGGALFEVVSGEPRVFYSARDPVAFQENLTVERLTAGMLSTLKSSVALVEKYYSGLSAARELKNIGVFFSSPWHSSETKVLTLDLTIPTVITKTMIEKLIATEDAVFRGHVARDGGKGKQPSLLERMTMGFRLNGYPTAKPYGQKATEVSAVMFESLVSRKIRDTVRHVLERLHPTGTLSYYAFPAAAQVVLRELSGLSQFVTVRIGGEVTDVMLVRDGVLAATATFPTGRNSLERKLKRFYATHPHCALASLIALRRDSAIGTKDSAIVDEALRSTKQAWLDSLRKVCADFSRGGFLPRTVFVFEEEGAHSPFPDWLAETPSELFGRNEPITVTMLDRNSASFFVGHEIQKEPDVALAIEAAFMASGFAL